MITAKGYAAQTAESPLAPWHFERRDIGAHDVQIEILYCGVCHTDIHLTRNEWFPGIFPMVPGHEIVGRISAVGAHVKKFSVGNLGGVGVMVDACRECEDCKNGQEQFCTVAPVQTYNNLDHEGKPAYGGYSDSIVVNEDFVHRISEKLDLAAVAPLLCAGITTYSPLKKFNVGTGHKLAVVGLGGLGHMGVKFGKAFGAEVTVISTSPNKEVAARELGADHFVISRDEEQMKNVFKHFDFVLDTVASSTDINPYLNTLKTNGVYINVGLPSKPWEVSSFSLAVGNKTIAGSGAGGLPETQEMLDFCAEHNIVSEIELIDIKDIHMAYDRMQKGDVKYRFVIDMKTL
ncbi:NAD(P)-dependent alcohol dehydrogenase [Mucilaginibacter auburnensis]|uniref:Putative zinc-type alcohol dehydrogenase-like protein n=1 Tax=Mucilaginibacter auburnensis TaxID=1457233 RepID=A0A2H9VV25_9SPHI|nr:NAD(P)-dependent alcohol dehydrogenase [Mucilaginibacter auburnensis]PJJ84661.1 putative zinc-type alcohol dehydrogenase-like protein [Mucilaginibacter auburnensis]